MSAVPPIKNLRWYIAILLCLSTELNYLDRQTLSVLASTIQKDLGLDRQQYSYVTSAFLATYMVMYAVGGRIVDRLGTRRGLMLFASSWSVVNMLHGLARSLPQLAFFRALLGVTEAANIPAGVKAVSEWFPLRERALAVGIFNAGTAIGGAAAVPIVGTLALHLGWRSAFVVTGALGLLWVAAWAYFYDAPARHRRLGEAERLLIAAGRPTEPAPRPTPVRALLSMRETWGCIVARVLTDPISYFLNFWVPQYLQDERGFSLAAMVKVGWIPFAALALGNVAAGGHPARAHRSGMVAGSGPQAHHAGGVLRDAAAVPGHHPGARSHAVAAAGGAGDVRSRRLGQHHPARGAVPSPGGGDGVRPGRRAGGGGGRGHPAGGGQGGAVVLVRPGLRGLLGDVPARLRAGLGAVPGSGAHPGVAGRALQRSPPAGTNVNG
jgi:MFS family permease